jgi:uncharacterized protein YihD (DUF1040 family)
MRDPKRIDLILELLKKYWQKYPDLRFLQIVGNGFPWRGSNNNHYNTEDWQVEDYLKRLVQEDVE